jgi:hypothetical protein
LNNFLRVVKNLKVDVCGVVETWFGGGEGKGKMEEVLREDNFVWIGKDREG